MQTIRKGIPLKQVIGIWLLLLTTLIYADDCKRCYQQRAALAMECAANQSLYALYPRWCRTTIAQARFLNKLLPKVQMILQQSKNIKKVERMIKPWVSIDPCDRCYSKLYTVALFNCYSKDKALIGTKYCKTTKMTVDILYRDAISYNPSIPIRN